MSQSVNSASKVTTVTSSSMVRTNHVNLINGWQPYTPVFTGFTLNAATTSKFRYMLLDRTLFLQGFISQLGVTSTVTGVEYNFTLPTGFSMNIAGVVGSGFVNNIPGTDAIVGVVRTVNTTTLAIAFNDPASASPILRQWGVTAHTPANLRLDAQPVFASINCTIQLDPTCAGLAATL